MEPVLKWAGGKRQLIRQLVSYINLDSLNGHRYYEPFIGGGALAFSLEYSDVVINDSNKELINVYEVIKKYPNELILELKKHEAKHSKDYYYKIRELDRNIEEYKKMSNIEKAARIVYLNKTCYNGLYRVNSKGFNNVPIGRTTSRNPDIVMESRIITLSNYLNNNNVIIRCGDFKKAVQDANAGDIIYFDPPYDYEKEGFKAYVKTGFTHDDLKRLSKTCDDLISRGCIVIISNNDTKFVRQCFSSSSYKINEVVTKRYINCNGEKRTLAKEVIIYGKK